MKKTQQEIKVLAINTLYEHAQKMYEYEMQHFSQFIGKDIFKVDGSVKAKFAHDKMEAISGQLADGTYYHTHYWFENSYGNFRMMVKTCINGGSYDVQPATAFCQYEETSISLFKVVDNNLTAIEKNTEYLKERFNVDTLAGIANEIKELAKKYEVLSDKMPYQFKGVFNVERLTR